MAKAKQTVTKTSTKKTVTIKPKSTGKKRCPTCGKFMGTSK